MLYTWEMFLLHTPWLTSPSAVNSWCWRQFLLSGCPSKSLLTNIFLQQICTPCENDDDCACMEATTHFLFFSLSLMHEAYTNCIHNHTHKKKNPATVFLFFSLIFFISLISSILQINTFPGISFLPSVLCFMCSDYGQQVVLLQEITTCCIAATQYHSADTQIHTHEITFSLTQPNSHINCTNSRHFIKSCCSVSNYTKPPSPPNWFYLCLFRLSPCLKPVQGQWHYNGHVKPKIKHSLKNPSRMVSQKTSTFLLPLGPKSGHVPTQLKL